MYNQPMSINSGGLISLGKDLVSSVLTEGAIVSTKLYSGNVWLQNIIYKSENHLISISLLYEYMENIIMVGQPIAIKFSNESNEFVFDGEVVDIHPDFPGYINIHISAIKEIKNVRNSPRYDVYLASAMKIKDYDKECFAIVHNISLSGIAFYSKDDFHPQEENVKTTIYLSQGQTLNVTGRITRKKPYADFIDYGMNYTTNPDNNTVSSYFASLEVKKTDLRSEFMNKVKKHL